MVQTWEYLDVFIIGQQWVDSTGAKGELLTSTQLGVVTARLNAPLFSRYGAQGWELVGQTSDGQGATYTFKRPAQGLGPAAQSPA